MATIQCPVCGSTPANDKGCLIEFEGLMNQLVEIVDSRGFGTGIYELKYTTAQAHQIAFSGHFDRQVAAGKAMLAARRANVAAGKDADTGAPLIGLPADIAAAKAAALEAIEADSRNIETILDAKLEAIRGAGI